MRSDGRVPGAGSHFDGGIPGFGRVQRGFEAKVFVMNMHVEKVVRLRWRKSHVAKVKDEFRHVEEPGQIFSAAETVEPRKITGSDRKSVV